MICQKQTNQLITPIENLQIQNSKYSSLISLAGFGKLNSLSQGF